MTRSTYTHTHTHTLLRRTVTTTGSQKQTVLSVANSPLRSGLNLTSTHQMAPSSAHKIKALLLIYRLRKDERLSWPNWLTCSGRFTYIKAASGRMSSAGQSQFTGQLCYTWYMLATRL